MNALRSVRHDGNIRETLSVKCLTNRADTAIHHVRGRNHICTRTGLRNSLLAKVVHGLIIHDDTIRTDHAVVTHSIVRVESNISVHLEIREGVLQQGDRALSETVRVEALLSRRGLQVVRSLRKDNDLVHAGSTSLADLVDHTSLPAEASLSRHGVDRDVLFTVVHKDWVDEVRRRQDSLCKKPGQETIVRHGSRPCVLKVP